MCRCFTESPKQKHRRHHGLPRSLETAIIHDSFCFPCCPGKRLPPSAPSLLPGRNGYQNVGLSICKSMKAESGSEGHFRPRPTPCAASLRAIAAQSGHTDLPTRRERCRRTCDRALDLCLPPFGCPDPLHSFPLGGTASVGAHPCHRLPTCGIPRFVWRYRLRVARGSECGCLRLVSAFYPGL